MVQSIFYPDLWMPWRFWLWTSGYLSSVASLTSKLVWSHPFCGEVSGHSSPVKTLTDWNGSCSIPLSVMLLKQLATASRRQMQSCKTPILTVHSQRLRNMSHLYTFVEYHHLNMRISVRKPPDLAESPQLWHHFLGATGDGICYPSITKFSSSRTESISTSPKMILN